MAKFIAVDANGLNFILGSDTITYIKSNCKKRNSPKQVHNPSEVSQNDGIVLQQIMLSGFCTSEFQFELFSWEINVLKTDAVFHEHFSSPLSYRYLDNDSPPPRNV